MLLIDFKRPWSFLFAVEDPEPFMAPRTPAISRGPPRPKLPLWPDLSAKFETSP